jgi:hypothetical protein
MSAGAVALPAEPADPQEHLRRRLTETRTRVDQTQSELTRLHAEMAQVQRIVSVSVGGVVVGTASATDHFGFVAQQVGSFHALGFTARLTAGRDIIELSPTTDDVTMREV